MTGRFWKEAISILLAASMFGAPVTGCMSHVSDGETVGAEQAAGFDITADLTATANAEEQFLRRWAETGDFDSALASLGAGTLDGAGELERVGLLMATRESFLAENPDHAAALSRLLDEALRTYGIDGLLPLDAIPLLYTLPSASDPDVQAALDALGRAVASDSAEYAAYRSDTLNLALGAVAAEQQIPVVRPPPPVVVPPRIPLPVIPAPPIVPVRPVVPVTPVTPVTPAPPVTPPPGGTTPPAPVPPTPPSPWVVGGVLTGVGLGSAWLQWWLNQPRPVPPMVPPGAPGGMPAPGGGAPPAAPPTVIGPFADGTTIIRFPDGTVQIINPTTNPPQNQIIPPGGAPMPPAAPGGAPMPPAAPGGTPPRPPTPPAGGAPMPPPR